MKPCILRSFNAISIQSLMLGKLKKHCLSVSNRILHCVGVMHALKCGTFSLFGAMTFTPEYDSQTNLLLTEEICSFYRGHKSTALVPA